MNVAALSEQKQILLYQTPERWAAQALADPLALLSDHAYLERKAAANALELLNRWPEPHCPATWTQTLSGIARDEALHLDMVIRVLRQRGGKLERLHRSAYANALRSLVRNGKGPQEILDRLLVCALIEARSYERFGLLARHCADTDKELARFYDGLRVSELGHYTVFLALAEEIRPSEDVEKRWNELREAEAWLIASQTPGPGIHSGVE